MLKWKVDREQGWWYVLPCTKSVDLGLAPGLFCIVRNIGRATIKGIASTSSGATRTGAELCAIVFRNVVASIA